MFGVLNIKMENITTYASFRYCHHHSNGSGNEKSSANLTAVYKAVLPEI